VSSGEENSFFKTFVELTKNDIQDGTGF